ncbi:MAG TPA: T9SS type A sorting domain-containing protein, partial [Prolixibacteraceae bacterium]|nr:T9SS type A sorting domain-containing protein [Prolixibacteraceae bacterium]
SSGIDAASLFAGLVTGNQIQPANLLDCKVFPNPFTTKIKISCTKEIESILIYNSEGQLIENLEGNHSEINLDNLLSGVYLIQIVADKQVFNQKIVKK